MKENNITYINLQKSKLEKLKKISTRPLIIKKKSVSENDFYFDENNLYVINEKFQKINTFKLVDIVEVSKTYNTINNKKIWQIKIKEMDKEVLFEFVHNYSMFNKNFYLFYNKVKTINPNAIKTKWRLWNL